MTNTRLEANDMTRLKDLEKKVETLSQLLDMEVEKLERTDFLDELDKEFEEWDKQAADGKPVPSLHLKGKIEQVCAQQEPVS